MKTIIVPLDGSELAELALAPALALGAAAGMTVRVIATRWETGTLEPSRYLRGVADQHPEVETELILDRSGVDAVLMALGEASEPVACMATHGRSGLGQAVLGSVAEGVVRGAHRPVMLVGPSIRPAAGGAERLVVAWDGSQLSAACAPTVVELSHLLHAPVTVVEVTPVSLGVASPAPVPPEVVRDTLEAQLRSAGVDVVRMVRHGDPATEIVDAVDETGATYVVMATHGRTGLARIALGSVAMRVVRHSPRPVIVVRPPDLH
jgi:nucleotide-binding universal stress UspA family protein